MKLTIFKILTALFLLICVNLADSKINPDIFSIIDDYTLQRKLEFSVNDTANSTESSLSENASKLSHYLSLVSDEMNELKQIQGEKFKEDAIPLSSGYIEISPDEIKFYELSFDDFLNFKKAPVRLETIIPDGSDPNSIRILYESKISEIVLSGLAEVNGLTCDFVLNITDLTLQEEHERTPTSFGKIVTKSITERLTFKKFTMLILSSEGNKLIKSPNKQILRRLADSWLVSIVNVVNSRFVQPKITEQSQLYFKNYKNSYLEAICSSVLQTFQTTKSISFFYDVSVRSEDSEYDKYIFRDIVFENFSTVSNCSSGSFSVEIEKNGCGNDNYYSHALNFAFTYLSNRRFARPFINCTLEKYRAEKRDPYGNTYIRSKTTEEQLFAIVRYWSAKLTISTDKNGKKADEDVRVSIDFELEKSGTSRLNDLSNRLMEKIRSVMTTLLRDQLQLLLTTPAESKSLSNHQTGNTSDDL